MQFLARKGSFEKVTTMPVGFCYTRPVDLGPFIRRYRAEYLAKGCSARKAEDLAYAKARKKWREGKIMP